MSDGAGDKPFEPSHHRLSEARRRGEVPQVRDLPLVAGALAAAFTVWAQAPWLALRGRAWLDSLLLNAIAGSSGADALAPILLQTGSFVLAAVVAPLLAAAAVGTLVRFLLVGPVLSAKPVTPDFKRLNPAQGLKRLASAQAWVQVVKSLLALALSLGALAMWMRSLTRDALRLVDTGSVLILGSKWWLTGILLGLGLLLCVSALDVAYQRRAFRKRLRMDRKDLKDEYRQLEGDPEMKAKRAAQQRELGRS